VDLENVIVEVRSVSHTEHASAAYLSGETGTYMGAGGEVARN
jgi:hypothetical protein